MWTLTGFADEVADDLDEQLALFVQLGLRYVEFRSAWGVNVLALSDAQLTDAKRRLDDAGIAVSSVGSPIGKIGITDPFDPHLEQARHAVDVAHRLGARYIRIFSFFMPAGDDPAVHRAEVLRRLTALTDIAAAGDVVLLHENEKDIYGDVPQRCLDLFDSVGSPHLRAIIDPANYVQCGVRPFDEAYPLIRPHLEYMHIKDAVAGRPVKDAVAGRPNKPEGHVPSDVVPAGEGDGQVREIVRALADSGFDGFFSIEPHLGDYTAFGALSGPQLWTKAHVAFTRLLADEGVAWDER